MELNPWNFLNPLKLTATEVMPWSLQGRAVEDQRKTL